MNCDLKPGAIYYRVTFALPDSGAPSVSAMRYVGVNLVTDDSTSEPTYYFESPNEEVATSNKHYFIEQDFTEVRDLSEVVELLSTLIADA